tara:strand:- start:132 stop:356 length:225 start_codon:yes stop_codon:yes gene_type:complete
MRIVRGRRMEGMKNKLLCFSIGLRSRISVIKQSEIENKGFVIFSKAAGSSNGRTPGFGPGDLGSNPSPAALDGM